jgi:hypothetical protein
MESARVPFAIISAAGRRDCRAAGARVVAVLAANGLYGFREDLLDARRRLVGRAGEGL